MGRRRRRNRVNQRIWDVGLVQVESKGRRMRAVTVIEEKERRFFEVRKGAAWQRVVVAALEARFRAVGWWAIPTAMRIEDPKLVWVIRSSEILDDCEIVELDGLISLRWAARALERYLDGSNELESESIVEECLLEAA